MPLDVVVSASNVFLAFVAMRKAETRGRGAESTTLEPPLVARVAIECVGGTPMACLDIAGGSAVIHLVWSVRGRRATS